jgi:tRNA threonylcarbamoyladenosine biosynthesis protein TsaE
MKKWTSFSVDDLPQIVAEVKDYNGEHKTVLLVGHMGAGKTTFSKAFSKELGVKTDVSSPTFALVNHYETATEGDIFHFDFYRIEDESEAYDIGFEEYLDSGNWCLIEWPDRVEGIIKSLFH